MNASRMGTVLRLVGIGWYVALCIGGGAVGGRFLDRQLDFGFPILTLLGVRSGDSDGLCGNVSDADGRSCGCL